jgi:hypothetical protein
MSNHNAGENPAHRKSKVSWAMAIIPGLGGPKARPKGVVDGQPVNIPALPPYSMKGRVLVCVTIYWINVELFRMLERQIPLALIQGNSRSLRQRRRRIQSRAPGKASKNNRAGSVLKPTQVDWASSLR